MAQTHWYSSASQQKPCKSGAIGFLCKHRVALFNRGPRDIAHRFLASQFHQQFFSGLHPIQREPSPHKGHRADIFCDVQRLISCKLRGIAHCLILLSTIFSIDCQNNHCET